ncbi:DUF3397 domain-containing protein [Carnobacterium divergens]|uniref:DUF3397 domain-containing protein n=1 Tax=Carnobacterium divergens TaxID=2748 RepID=A0A5F0MCR9_CARDV|nr:DUF3397 domain-containing protein [Carnobacterium divergens]TFI70173.1 DUF3397 domain-containing protein [Carnobacterium divergens]TFI70844.1 DUF3397 domain-containing protein [Carnobacterium divergens]TFI75167.1 DUF3397 domain-containing protein [Carnobacterium divergens]TFI80991.1 DUF3397 domain-containing protein [Carnobacterium divergens]TFI93398.1 DUF3397 domain-containing protein [Carnobacterium divergens]
MKLPIAIEELILYLLPIFLLWGLGKLIHKGLLVLKWNLKAPDLLVPFLFVGIHILSRLSFSQSWLPYFTIFILAIGIVILMMLAVKKGEILYSQFFKLFWRFTFISSFILYYVLVVIDLVKTFI